MRTWAIAANTLRDISRQPAYPIVLAGFALLLLASPLYTVFGFGSEGALVREAGLSTVVLCGLLVSLLVSSRVVHSEIERGTARFVLSKGIAPHQFLLGKFTGLACILLAVVTVLTGALAATVAWSEGAMDAGLLLGGIAAYTELLLLGAVTLSLSVHLSLVPTTVLSLVVFLLARLPSFFGQPGAGLAPRLLLPDLNSHHLVFQAVTTRTPLGTSTLLMAALYCILYSAAVLSLGVFWLSKRENL